MYSQILFTTSRKTIVHAWLLVYACLGIDVKTLKVVLARQWAGVWLGIGWAYLTRCSAISLMHARALQHRKCQITRTITKFSCGFAHALTALTGSHAAWYQAQGHDNRIVNVTFAGYQHKNSLIAVSHCVDSITLLWYLFHYSRRRSPLTILL